MSDEQKKPVWPWIVAVLIGLPVLYVASFGPACRLTDRRIIPESITKSVYRPLGVVVGNYCPDSICNAMTDYGMDDVDRGGVATAVDIIIGAQSGPASP